MSYLSAQKSTAPLFFSGYLIKVLVGEGPELWLPHFDILHAKAAAAGAESAGDRGARVYPSEAQLFSDRVGYNRGELSSRTEFRGELQGKILRTNARARKEGPFELIPQIQ